MVGRQPLPRARPYPPPLAGEETMRSMVEGASDRMRAPRKTTINAQNLRRTMSAPEAQLWSRLRQRAPDRPTFRRQHPIGPFVLDFFCARAQLAIEVDGL